MYWFDFDFILSRHKKVNTVHNKLLFIFKFDLKNYVSFCSFSVCAGNIIHD